MSKRRPRSVVKSVKEHLPPADFDKRPVKSETIKKGSVYKRIHLTSRAPIQFNQTKAGRYNSPEAEFGVLYIAKDLAGCFSETLLRQKSGLIDQAELDARSVSEIVFTADLKLVSFYGPGLARAGATGIVSSGDWDISQAWSLALWQRKDKPDGMLYRAKHDKNELSAAIFDRAGKNLKQGKTWRLRDDPELPDLLDRYKVGIG